MLLAIIVYIIITILSLASLIGFDLSIFNPIRNYHEWRTINWFGIIIITFILNIMLLPYAIVYWGIYKLFTIGRK